MKKCARSHCGEQTDSLFCSYECKDLDVAEQAAHEEGAKCEGCEEAARAVFEAENDL